MAASWSTFINFAQSRRLLQDRDRKEFNEIFQIVSDVNSTHQLQIHEIMNSGNPRLAEIPLHLRCCGALAESCQMQLVIASYHASVHTAWGVVEV